MKAKICKVCNDIPPTRMFRVWPHLKLKFLFHLEANNSEHEGEGR